MFINTLMPWLLNKIKDFIINHKVNLNVHTFDSSIFLLNLDNLGRPGVPDGLEGDGGFVQPPLPLRLLVPGGVLAAAPPLQIGRCNIQTLYSTLHWPSCRQLTNPDPSFLHNYF